MWNLIIYRKKKKISCYLFCKTVIFIINLQDTTKYVDIFFIENLISNKNNLFVIFVNSHSLPARTKLIVYVTCDVTYILFINAYIHGNLFLFVRNPLADYLMLIWVDRTLPRLHGSWPGEYKIPWRNRGELVAEGWTQRFNIEGCTMHPCNSWTCQLDISRTSRTGIHYIVNYSRTESLSV